MGISLTETGEMQVTRTIGFFSLPWNVFVLIKSVRLSESPLTDGKEISVLTFSQYQEQNVYLK